MDCWKKSSAQKSFFGGATTLLRLIPTTRVSLPLDFLEAGESTKQPDWFRVDKDNLGLLEEDHPQPSVK
jgi:hypothetical protein